MIFFIKNNKKYRKNKIDMVYLSHNEGDDIMIKIPVGVSNRHVHLTKEDVDILFGTDYKLTKKRDLSQIGQFACEEVVSIKNKDKTIEHVRVLGPVRNYTQVEIMKTDADYLELNPPIRNSGDLDNSETITIIGPKGEIERKNSCIIATRHIHINSREYPNLLDNSIVKLKVKDNIIMDNVYIKKDPSFVLELHIDKDDAKNFNLENGDVVILE